MSVGIGMRCRIRLKQIELIDEKILAPIILGLDKIYDYRILVIPDHATPLSLKTHTNDPVPFFIYDSRKVLDGVDVFNENTARDTGFYIEKGYEMMKLFLGL